MHPHHGPRTTMTDFHNLIPDKRIDYIFGTDDLDVVQHAVCSDTYDNGAYPSDHLPVIADLPTASSRELSVYDRVAIVLALIGEEAALR